MFGSKIGASRALKIPVGHLKPCDFDRLTPASKAAVLEVLRRAVERKELPEAVQAADGRVSDEPKRAKRDLPLVGVEAFVPNQADIDLTRRLCRVLISHIDLYTNIEDMGVRHSVRDMLESEFLDLLQTLRRHSANHPGALAERFRGEERMRSVLKAATSPSRPKKGQ
jgi:hypothetical protein